MEYRLLGGSGLMVSAITMGTATFGGSNEFWRGWGTTQLDEAIRLVDMALDAGVTLFDTADVYSAGRSEEILGKALGKRRDQALIATKATFRMDPGPNGQGSSRYYLTRACEASLRRLGTDHIDLYQLHGFDALTPVEEVLRALDDLIRDGKVLYVGCSNFSGWHLMKSLAVSEKYGLPRYVTHQAYYSLASREYEWELMTLALDQKVGTLVWSPLAGGLLTGKIRRNQPVPDNTRAASGSLEHPITEIVYRVVEVMDEIAEETGKTHAQIALNWLLRRPTVTTLVVGTRNEEQFRENLGAIGWSLTPEQVARLDAASEKPKIYPYWHQAGFKARNPFPCG